LLAGLNSSGKGTVLQALRMWSKVDLLPGYGTDEDLRSSLGGFYSINVTLDNNRSGVLLDSDLKIDTDGVPEIKILALQQPIYYLGAERLGPRTSLPLRVDLNDGHVGEQGELVVDVLQLHMVRSGIPEKLRAKDIKAAGFRDNIEAWLREISPGVEFQYHTMKEADLGRTEFSRHRPANVGFGLSYVLPILTSVLSIASDTTKKIRGEDAFLPVLLLENPEAHLHPRGQTIMGKFLAYAAASGVQCIIETHSEHIFNGIRLAIKEKQLLAQDAVGYFFSYSFSEEKSAVQAIFFEESGMCDNWPNGFFDESEKVLIELL
jgi:predicted ATPase